MSGSTDGWYVYLLECGDGSLYAGVTKDLGRRISEHNAGGGARYTRSRLPVTLVYTEPATDRAAAQRREYEIRRLSRRAKEQLIRSGPAG